MTARLVPYSSSPEAAGLNARFADNVNALLLSKGWSQKRLSEESHVPARTIENALSRNTGISVVGAHWIAQALGVSLDALLENTTQYFVERSGQAVLQCTHTERHLRDSRGESRGVCPSCLGGWQFLQERRRQQFEASR